MAQKYWDAEIFVVNSDSQFVPKFPTTTQVRADYDPQGLSIKIKNGEFQKRKQQARYSLFLFFLLD